MDPVLLTTFGTLIVLLIFTVPQQLLKLKVFSYDFSF